MRYHQIKKPRHHNLIAFITSLENLCKMEESILVNSTIANTSPYFKVILLNITTSLRAVSLLAVHYSHIIYLIIRSRELATFSSINFVKKMLDIFPRLWSFWHLASRYLLMFSDKPVFTDKAWVNSLIYLVDRPSSLICFYKLDDAFSHKT